MTEDQLVLTDLKVNSEILVVPDLLVCKDFVVYLAAPDLPASLVALVNVVCPVLTARTVNKDLRVFKVFQDLLVFRENVVPW